LDTCLYKLIYSE